jgi:PTH1 family peptidyl-tRNA hydrolase
VKLIAGLGNPGSRYRGTRHNVGFDVLDELARRQGVTFDAAPADALVARVRTLGPGVLLIKPLTFMNLSGAAVAALARYYRVEAADALVVLDDVNLPLGRLRLRRGGSAGGHNGLASVIEAFGTDAIARLRIGVGRGDPRRDLADHVLARFDTEEREVVQAATARAADAAERFVTDAIETVMNAVNAEPDTGPAS